MSIIDSVFAMGDGYVLEFSNRTFAQFFREELNVDIDAPRWSIDGTSKAKRLRSYLGRSRPEDALDALKSLWEYRETRQALGTCPAIPDPQRAAFFRILARLGGGPPEPAHADTPPAPINRAVATGLASRLIEVSRMDPHARGFEFERFLKDLFDAYGLASRASFRLVGEQIDGSLVLAGETYLLEARWRNTQADAAALRSFNAKVEDKAAWTRGLFISQSGFTKEGLHAFGRGNSVVCMSGLDLHETLSRGLDLALVLATKVRRAAETGIPYVAVHDLPLSTPQSPA